MKPKTRLLALIAVGLIAATPAWAQRSHGAYGGHGGHGGHGAYGGHGGHGGHGYNRSWGPFGFLLGTAILYSALQPRTVYYEPQVVYSLPPYAPVTVQPYYVEPSYVYPPVVSTPPPRVAQTAPLEEAGGQWWYFCKKPTGYYPYIRECPSGWERIPPTPPGVVKP